MYNERQNVKDVLDLRIHDERCTDGYGRLDTEKGLRTRTLVWTYRHGRNMDGRKSWWG
jgi:hypothetical protein